MSVSFFFGFAFDFCGLSFRSRFTRIGMLAWASSSSCLVDILWKNEKVCLCNGYNLLTWKHNLNIFCLCFKYILNFFTLEVPYFKHQKVEDFKSIIPVPYPFICYTDWGCSMTQLPKHNFHPFIIVGGWTFFLIWSQYFVQRSSSSYEEFRIFKRVVLQTSSLVCLCWSLEYDKKKFQP